MSAIPAASVSLKTMADGTLFGLVSWSSQITCNLEAKRTRMTKIVDTEKAVRFDHEKNITVGKARVIYATGSMWRLVDGWVLPGGKRTNDYMEAFDCAVAMDKLMGD